MLTALLDYSSLGRKYEAIETVDTGALVQAVIESLPESAHRVAVSGEWPVLATLRAPLDLVLRNLVVPLLDNQNVDFPVVFWRDWKFSPQFLGRSVLQCSGSKRETGVTIMRAKTIAMASCFAGIWLASAVSAEDYQLPPEVTPQIRAACEGDVRRLCIGANPTVEKVKSCVAAKFSQLGNRCQMHLAMAGLKP